MRSDDDSARPLEAREAPLGASEIAAAAAIHAVTVADATTPRNTKRARPTKATKPVGDARRRWVGALVGLPFLLLGVLAAIFVSGATLDQFQTTLVSSC